MSDKGWKGGYSDSEYLGNPSDIKDRQFASAGSEGYHGGGNIITGDNEVEVDLYLVPSFQGQSGQGANQSTDRPMGST